MLWTPDWPDRLSTVLLRDRRAHRDVIAQIAFECPDAVCDAAPPRRRACHAIASTVIRPPAGAGVR